MTTSALKTDFPHKALSVRQPWAWAIIFGGKDVENRSWHAMQHLQNRRGPLAIHASRNMSRRDYEDAAQFMSEIGVKCPHPSNLVRGAVIGRVEIVDAVVKHPSKWYMGPRCLVLDKPEPCAPIYASGLLGYFDWTERMSGEGPPMARWMKPEPADNCSAGVNDGQTELFTGDYNG